MNQTNEIKIRCVESLLTQKVNVLLTRNAVLYIIGLLEECIERNANPTLGKDPVSALNVKIDSGLIEILEKAIM